jgi:hypothetical protein
MFGLVLRRLADRPPKISASWDHRLGGSLWASSGHSLIGDDRDGIHLDKIVVKALKVVGRHGMGAPSTV